MTNPNDRIREALLRYLYDLHQKARSPKSAGKGIRDITSGMKPLGFKQQEVASNLDYLIQKGWVTEVVEERAFTTPRGTRQNSERRLYKISAAGIDRLESASTYQRPPTATHVNITNIRGVTVVGDGNVVNTEFTDLANVLSELRQVVLNAEAVPDRNRLEIAADIDTLQAQLQKPEPDPAIVQRVWSGIEKAVTAAGFVDLADRAARLLLPLLSAV